MLEADADIEAQRIGELRIDLAVPGPVLELGGEGGVAFVGFDHRDPDRIGRSVAGRRRRERVDQQVRPQHADAADDVGIAEELVRSEKQEIAARAGALGVGIGAADRDLVTRHDRVAHVEPARPQVFVEIGEGDAAVAAVAVVQPVDPVMAERIGVRVRPGVFEEQLERRLAFRIRVAAARIDLEIGRDLELTGKLAVEQLPLVPSGALLREVGSALVPLTKAEPRLLVGVVDIEVGPADAAVAKLVAEPE